MRDRQRRHLPPGAPADLTDATAFLPQPAKDASAHATPLGRNAEPEDVAGAILAIVADATGFVTGSYLPVSGGSLML